MHHEDALVGCYHVGAAPLQHGHVGAVLAEILRNIVSAVAAAHDDNLLALDVVLGCIVVLAAVVHFSFELCLSRESGNPRLARVPGTPDDVMRAECPLRAIVAAGEVNHPFGLGVIVLGGLDVGLEPHVQLHDAGVRFEPVA